ncbi:GAF domain-containing protein [Streptomyces sp. B6B3]|uniref:sensor histidine kinase n=1 Tax=Streptomyces sp. B6B3 TaxID=3153570 RepID=UPI00325CC5AC
MAARHTDPSEAANGITPELARRMPRLLQAMEAIGGDVELHSMLDRIVTTAAELADARYAALAVLNEDGSGVGEFVTHGVDPHAHTAVGRLPGSSGLIRAMLESTDSTDAMLVDELAADPRFAGFPPGHPTMHSMVGVPIRVYGAAYGALYLADKAEGRFSADDLQILRVLATEAGIAVGNARLYEAVRQQARWMDGSLELSTSLLSGDVDHALAVVAEQARRLAGAAVGAVLEPTDRAGEPSTDALDASWVSGGGNLEIVAVSADEPAGLLGTVVPADTPAARRVLAGEPIFMDEPADAGEPADPDADLFVGAGLARRFGPRMALPLASDGRTMGVLALARGPGGAPYSVPERSLATQFAQQAALALVLTRSRVDREQLAVLEDRDRIARDLHDLVIQRLFAVGMMLEGAQRGARSEAPDIAGRIEAAARELDAIVQEIRTAIFALQHEPDEAPTGLRTRVLRETGAAAQTLGFTPSVGFRGAVDARVPGEVADHLVAALREALSNAARHARPTRLEVTVEITDGSVRMVVADNGVGMPEAMDPVVRDGTSPTPGGGGGLRNIRRRAEGLGGSVEIGPGLEGTGTALIWQVPLTPGTLPA